MPEARVSQPEILAPCFNWSCVINIIRFMSKDVGILIISAKMKKKRKKNNFNHTENVAAI